MHDRRTRTAALQRSSSLAWAIIVTWLCMLAFVHGAQAQSANSLTSKKSFVPDTILSGGVAELRVRITFNTDIAPELPSADAAKTDVPKASAAGIGFTDDFPPGLVLMPGFDPTQCGGGLVEATPTGFRFSNGLLNEWDHSCTVTVNVTATSPTTIVLTNTTSRVTTGKPLSTGPATATLTVIGISPPKITSPKPLGGIVGVPYFHQVTVTGSPAVTVTAQGLPPGLQFSPDTLAVTGTPTQAGSFAGSFHATNGIVPDDQQDFVIGINNPPLRITTPLPLTGPVLAGFPFALLLQATGGALPYTWSLAGGTLPAGINLLPDGRIIGAPTQSGVFDFTARVTDSAGASDTRAFQVVVLANTTAVRFEITPNPAVAGQPVTVTAFVDTLGGGPATGLLTVWIAGSGNRCPDPFETGPLPLTALTGNKPLAGGTAQVVFPGLSIDNFRVCALYSGDSAHEASLLGPVDLFVIKGVLLPEPKVGLSVPGRVSPGSTVSARVVVEPVVAGLVPRGHVRLRDGVRDLGIASLEGGVARIPFEAPAAEGAVLAVTAAYEGDGVFPPAASDVATVAVIKAAVAAPDPIPALDDVALLLTMLALAAVGARRIARRRR